MLNETKIKVIEPNKEITNVDSEQELKPNETSNTPWVITELENNELIKHYWSLDKYLALKLLDVIENAVAPDNKWELHIDYRTRLRSMETILKSKDKNFWSWWVHVNFFSSPKQLKH